MTLAHFTDMTEIGRYRNSFRDSNRIPKFLEERFPGLINNFYVDGLRISKCFDYKWCLRPIRKYFKKDSEEYKKFIDFMTEKLSGINFTIDNFEFEYHDNIHLITNIIIQDMIEIEKNSY